MLFVQIRVFLLPISLSVAMEIESRVDVITFRFERCMDLSGVLAFDEERPFGQKTNLLEFRELKLELIRSILGILQ